MLGIVPAAGNASRLQPLGGSKELLPLGWERAAKTGGGERVRVVSENLLERMRTAGADRICFVVAGEKTDLLRYYGAAAGWGTIFFVVQPQCRGLCDAIFRGARFAAPEEAVLIGLPDTVWYPRAAYARAPAQGVHLITFPARHPEEFDAVVPGSGRRVAQVEVKLPGDPRRRVWGAITARGRELQALAELWRRRGERDQYLGHLLNAWIAEGGELSFDCQGTHYWDVGTPEGYARALADEAWRTECWETRSAARTTETT